LTELSTHPKDSPLSKRKNQGFRSTGINAVHPKKITEFDDRKGVESKFSYKLGERLTNNQKLRVYQLLEEFEPILATSFEDIKGSNL